MPTYTFADLRTAETVATIRQRLVDRLTAAGVPVSSWAPSSTGGVENLRLDMVANGMAALAAQRIAQAVTGRLLPTAVAAAAAETTPAVATLLLKKLGRDFYKLPMRDATYTIQNMRFSTIGTPSSYTFAPGELTVRADATGNLYTNVEGGQLQPGGTLDLPCQAEKPGSSYDDPAGTVTTMVTARAGVVCTNVAPADFTAARSALGSSGGMAASFTTPGVRPTFASVRVRITRGGQIGFAYYQLSTDGGATWVNGGTIQPTIVVPGGVTLRFTAGAAPSFLTGDIFTTFLGDALLQRGADAETPVAFGTRCSYRWRALSDVPTEDKIALWTHQASQEVERVWSEADPNIPGGILVTIASSSGPASPQALVAVEDFISARLLGYQGVAAAPGFTSLQETVQVSSAIRHEVFPLGLAYVPRAKIAAAQAGSAKGWDAYLRSIPIGGQKGAVVRAAVLEDILSDNGVEDAVSIQIADRAPSLTSDLVLAKNEVAVMAAGQTIANTIGWIPT